MFNSAKIEDYANLHCFFKEQSYSLCEYSLASMMAWNHGAYEVSFKFDGDILLIAEKDIGLSGERRLLMPLAKPFRIIPPAELAALAARNSFEKYHYVPEDYLREWGAEIDKHFRVQEQPGFMDYLYNSCDLACLKGRNYSTKRNLIAQFNKITASSHQVKVEPITSKNSGLCLDLLDRWKGSQETDKCLEMLNCERKAIKNSLRHFELLEMEGVMVLIDGEISGFALGSRLSNDTFTLNFEKALDGVKGLYQFLDNELAKRLLPHYTFINKESDLGKPGLVKSKESYYPVRKIKSFTLWLNSNTSSEIHNL